MAKQKGKKLRKLSETQKAYIAGFIDGEGCITISRKRCNDGTRGGIQYRLQVQAVNTNEKVMKWICNTTGLGRVAIQTQKLAHKDCFRWCLWSIQATQLLEQLMPYLIVKKKQAVLAIKFIKAKRDNVGRNGLTTKERNFQIKTHEKISILNRRGRQ